jgi:predicted Fe-Mo cluster-binding NifX family protein
MKIAISSDGNTIESKIDQRFGRCKYFIIVDSEKKNEIKVIENEGAIQGHGAGIKAAQQIGDLAVEAVITGNLGPNATAVLEKLEIKAYHASGTIKSAIDSFIDNKLEKINEVAAPHSGIAQKESKKERIFFPLLDNNGEDSEISEHFGHAPFFGIYDVEKKELKIIENDLDHTDPSKSPIDQIEEAVNPTTIFAKGIGGRAIGIIAEKGLSLKTGDYKTIGEAIKNLDKLEDQSQSCGHEHQ